MSEDVGNGENEDVYEFIDEYTKNVRAVSYITMMKNMGEVDEDVLEADVCWMLTDNIREILCSGGVVKQMRSDDHKEIIPFLREHLSRNRLIVISQDSDSCDHWFCLIGQDDEVHLIEQTPSRSDIVETFTLDEISEEIKSILIGVKPDRFYGNIGSHIFDIWVHERGLIHKDKVHEYLRYSY